MRNKFLSSMWNSYFDVGEDTIKVSGSHFTGYEYVYVNDQLVSKKLNWTFRSKHNVSVDGQSHEVLIELLSLLKPQIRIQVIKNGDAIDEDYIFKYGESGKKQLSNVWISVGFAFVTGMISYFLVSWFIGS